MQRLPSVAPSSTLPSASTNSGSTPKKGRVAEPGFRSVAPGSGVIRMPPVSASDQRLKPPSRSVNPTISPSIRPSSLNARTSVHFNPQSKSGDPRHVGDFLKSQVSLPQRQQSGSRDPKTTGGPRQEALSPHIAGYPGIR